MRSLDNGLIIVRCLTFDKSFRGAVNFNLWSVSIFISRCFVHLAAVVRLYFDASFLRDKVLSIGAFCRASCADAA